MFGIRQWLFSTVENRKDHLLKWLLSGLYFAISFILISYTSYAWSAANAWDVGYQPFFSYDGMDSLINTTGWTVRKVAWVYLAPPLWGLALSILGLIAYNLVDTMQTNLRAFLFWLSFNGFLLYFSYVISAILSGQVYSSGFFSGFVGFYSWLDWSRGTIYGILGIQLLASLLFSFVYSKPILQLNYSRLLASRKRGKSIIFINIVLIPYLIGIVLVAASTFPMDLNYQTVRVFSFLLIFVVAFLGMGFYKAKHITIVRGGLKSTPFYGFAIGCILLFLLAQFLLSIRIKPLW